LKISGLANPIRATLTTPKHLNHKKVSLLVAFEQTHHISMKKATLLEKIIWTTSCNSKCAFTIISKHILAPGCIHPRVGI